MHTYSSIDINPFKAENSCNTKIFIIQEFYLYSAKEQIQYTNQKFRER